MLAAHLHLLHIMCFQKITSCFNSVQSFTLNSFLFHHRSPKYEWIPNAFCFSFSVVTKAWAHPDSYKTKNDLCSRKLLPLPPQQIGITSLGLRGSPNTTSTLCCRENTSQSNVKKVYQTHQCHTERQCHSPRHMIKWRWIKMDHLLTRNHVQLCKNILKGKRGNMPLTTEVVLLVTFLKY